MKLSVGPGDSTLRLIPMKIIVVLHAFKALAAKPAAHRIVLGLFMVQAVLLVFVVHPGVPPDETNHIDFIEYYANHSISPFFTHQQPTYNLGDKTREVDYLYHYGMSLLYRIMPISVEAKYIVIRLFSVAFAVTSFVLLIRLLRRLGIGNAAITMCLLVLTNLPMVLMMSSAINNDVLVWVGVLGGMLLLIRLWETPRLTDLLWIFTLSAAGGLIKRTLLPIGLLFAALGLLALVRHRQALLPQLRRIDWRIVVASLVFAVSVGLFVERVGGNVWQYHTVTPSCEQVHDVASCAVFWGNVRAQTLAQLPPEPRLAIPAFVAYWFVSSIYNVLDIQTQLWLHAVQPAVWLTPILIVALLIGILYGLRTEHLRATDPQAKWRRAVLYISLYILLVQLVVNYGTYRDMHFFGIALNGRYILPAVLTLVGLACYYWARLLSHHQRWLTTLAVIVVVGLLCGSGLQMMLRNPQLYELPYGTTTTRNN